MFSAKKDIPMAQHSTGETIIAQGVRVEGDFHSSGDVVIDGEVSGSIETAQALTVGESARIQADVVANSARVAGEIKGNITAVERLELLASSVVEGDIETADLSIASGARVNGKVMMGGGKGKKEEKE
ncbi:polymer-forming cytoskeletal protein [Candidatus Parcubacteria bacterium]|nr:polymer-forming cytoskeletal protein [Candidatus Parcubacteria bacterium]